MASFFYTQGIAKMMKGDLDLDTADVRALLLKSSATPNKDDDTIATVVTGSGEISVSGYSRQTLTSETVTIDDTNDLVKFEASTPINFGTLAAGQTLQYLILFVQVTNDSDSYPLSCHDVGAIATSGVALDFNMNAGGYFRGQSA